MASATVLDIGQISPKFQTSQSAKELSVDSIMKEAFALIQRMKDALTTLQTAPELPLFFDATDEDDILTLSFNTIRVDEELKQSLPKRKSARHELACAIAEQLYPMYSHSLAPVIRYEKDRARIWQWIVLRRRYDLVANTKEREAHNWRLHIKEQGLWDPVLQPISFKGTPSLPMPVQVSNADSLKPFFNHLQGNGTHDATTAEDSTSCKILAEPYYATAALEFHKGVIYEDQRMDLCKMVVGPDHIGELMSSLKTSTFVKHFLLGNNIIGPKGAREIAAFVKEFPNRMDTWYLAGNAIYGPAFSVLVDSFIVSPAVTNIWLKRNPLGAHGDTPIDDLFRLITQTPNLRTLDLDQTELGDAGVAKLFNRLTEHPNIIPLENVYLNGNGIHVDAAKAIGNFLISSNCNLTSLYMSNNPIGDEGAKALAIALVRNTTLRRLALQSIGFGDIGAANLCFALKGNSTLKMLDLGVSYATEDLGQAYNFFTADLAPCVASLLSSSKTLEYLDVGTAAMGVADLNHILFTAQYSPSLLYLNAATVFKQQAKDFDSVKDGQEHAAISKLVKQRLLANVQAKYGNDMTYEQWLANEKRWVVSDKQDVRKIDSVYRNRDAGMARRGEKKLDKWWDESNEGTLRDAMGTPPTGPFCTGRKPTGFWAVKEQKKADEKKKAEEQKNPADGATGLKEQ